MKKRKRLDCETHKRSRSVAAGTATARRLRIKVGARPLIVRSGVELESQQIGQLLPGAIVTVIEERVTPGHVRACVALDHFDKEVSCREERHPATVELAVESWPLRAGR